MILADKIIRLRKKNGWSQEELADKMNVSRQAVSKWESAQTIPDLGKILQLGAIFDVTTDYLLKDDMESEEFIDEDSSSSVRRVTLQEANVFLEQRKKAALHIAIATFLCILAVVPLLLLGAASEFPSLNHYENLLCGIGLVLLFLLVAIAVIIFILCGFRNASFEFWDKEPFEIEYGVKGMVKERQKAYRDTYVKFNIIGTCICILSPIALFIGAFTEKEFFIVVMLTVMMLLAGIGVIFFIVAGVRWASMQKLLKEGEFSVKEKKKNRVKESIGTVYWLTATAIYLGLSFVSNDWRMTWIVWPIAGVLFAGVMVVCNLFVDRKEEKID